MKHAWQTQAEQKLAEADMSYQEAPTPMQSAQSLPPRIQALVKELSSSLQDVRDERVQALRHLTEAGMYQVDITGLSKKLLGL